MCGAPIAQGILCAKCDRPRGERGSRPQPASVSLTGVPSLRAKRTPTSAEAATVLETITSLSNVLAATGTAAAVIASDRSVEFATEELKELFGELTHIRELEQALGMHFRDLTQSFSSAISIRDRKMLLSVVPISSGVVIVLRRKEAGDPPQISDIPRIIDVIRSVVNRSIAFAEVKGIRLEISAPNFDERFRHHDKLADALGILVDNSLHYASAGGQIVVGMRPMEHKGQPILLFFVMDNGPLVPEHMKHIIFESGFLWNAQASERTGRGLYKVREFSIAHGGSVWVDSKTGKACTFFLRVNPDSIAS